MQLLQFGSWCYISNVDLFPWLALEDIACIIHALWVQHSKMKLCDVQWLTCNNHFMAAIVDVS